MIVAFSTSSPIASVALFSDAGDLLESAQEEAKQNASFICLSLLQRLLDPSAAITGFLADLGPGSFTGVKVGVTLAKTMAAARGVRVGGVASFDLIAADGLVVLPSKRGEYFWRGADRSVTVHQALPDEHYRGFGPGIESSEYPLAKNFAAAWHRIEWTSPEALVPAYILDPSISTPNKPYRSAPIG